MGLRRLQSFRGCIRGASGGRDVDSHDDQDNSVAAVTAVLTMMVDPRAIIALVMA